MKRGIFYLTFNGIFNNTNGIGTQTKTLLQGIENDYIKLSEEFGDFELNIVAPIFNDMSWGYSRKDIEYAEHIVNKTGGKIFYVPYCIDKSDFWTVNNWRSISYSAASTVLQNAKQYSESLVIAVDPPFLHAPLLIEQSRKDYGVNIKSLITLFSTTYLLEQSHERSDKLAWEFEGITSARKYNHIRLANICDSFTEHLKEYYGADEKSFADYASSLYLNSEDFIPFNKIELENILYKYKIPTDKKIILAFGRAHRTKGFDIFLNSLTNVKDIVHIVLVVVPYTQSDPILDEYRRIIKLNNIKNITLITDYTRELPRALSQWINTEIVVCPSRTDTFPNIPLEVALWAKDSGPICIGSNVNGIDEQIIEGFNGYKFDITNPETLATKLEMILELDKDTKNKIRKNAYEKVVKERDFYNNFRNMLKGFWDV